MNVQIYRANSSSYQDSAFIEKEREVLETLPGAKYVQNLGEMSDAPFFLISNTHTSLQDLPQVLLEKTALMVHPNSGHDNFSKNFVKSAAFPIVLGNPIRSHAVAEYILSCVFHHFTPVKNHTFWSPDRKWDRKLLRDQNVLILGYGNIGKILYDSLSPLCSKVEVFDPHNTEDFCPSSVNEKWSSSLARQKDIVIVAASLNKSSVNMINAPFLKNLPDPTLLINAARGEIVNEEDALLWLKKSPKSRAFLDVFKEEPFTPGFMQEASNLNKTSHIAGVYEKLNHDIIDFERAVMQDFLQFKEEENLPGFHRKYKRLLLTENSLNFS